MTNHQQPAVEPDASVKDRAAGAVEQGRQAAGEVTQTAAQHAAEVKDETVRQARDLLGEARSQLESHAGDQHRNLVTNLRALSSELGSMVDRSEQPGTATDLVAQARGRIDGAADWLDRRQPGDLVGELRTFARRRPGVFLLGALAAGVAAGRLTRGAVAAHTDGTSGTGTPGTGTPGNTGPASGDTTVLPESGFAHTTGPAGYEPRYEPQPQPQYQPQYEPQPGASAPGYGMGGSYATPPGAERPADALGYGAATTYGDGGTAPLPAGDPQSGQPR